MMPPEVAEIRRELCHCKGVNHDDPCAACPNGHFGRYEDIGCDDPDRKVPRLGDRIASIAQPVAGAIDTVLGTNIRKCGGCKQMRSDLNAGEPIIPTIIKRIKGV